MRRSTLNHDPPSAIIDGSQTRSNGDGFANLFIWFDNEWGFANRIVGRCLYVGGAHPPPQAETAAASA